MKIALKNGQLFVDGKPVLTMMFQNGTTQSFPIESDAEIILTSEAMTNTAAAFGSDNTVISGKNIVHGSNVNVKGDYRVGDG